MIYNGSVEYKIKFHTDIKTSKSPVLNYIKSLRERERSKIFKYIDFLRQRKGYLDEPYSRHIRGKIRELRVDFSRNRYRILYFIFMGKTIVVLHAFLKKTDKTPEVEIKKAEENHYDVLKNHQIYE